MAEYQGEYGHPYPRVDQYGNPVPPVDQYGNPVPREPASGLAGTGTASPYSAGADSVPVHVAEPVEYGASAGYPHDGLGSGGITAPLGGAAHPSGGGGVAPGETALAYEGMVGAGVGAATAGVGGGHLQPTREEHTFGPGAQLQPTKEEHTTTLGEKLRRSGSSSSSSVITYCTYLF